MIYSVFYDDDGSYAQGSHKTGSLLNASRFSCPLVAELVAVSTHGRVVQVKRCDKNGFVKM